MDPASIIGVVGVVAQLLKLVHVYGDGVAECRDEVAGLRVELFCLKSALTNIERDPLLSSTYRSDEFNVMLEEARALLGSLNQSLQSDTTRTQRLAQRLTWPLKRQHVKDITTRLERLKTYFILVATNDTLDATKVFATSLAGVQHSLTEMRMSEEDRATQAAVDDWLTFFDPEPGHEAVLSVRSEGTNGWFLDRVLKDWSRDSIQLLWLRGKPGSGKTCIAAATASSLMDIRKGSLVAHFYCSYNNAETQKPRTVMASLLKQLSHKSSSIWHAVTQAYKDGLGSQYRSGNATAGLSTLSQLIVDICANLLSQDVFFVIDAIDEGGVGSDEIVQTLFSIAKQCPSVRIVLTSTESMTDLIRRISDELKVSSMNVMIDPADIKDDIVRYVNSCFNHDRILSKLRPQLQAQIMAKMKGEHNGSFRWVQCTMDDLRCLATPRAIKEALADITPSLSNVYKAVLSSIPSSVAGFAWSMLVYLVSALRPLTLAELAEAAIFLSSPNFSEDDHLIDPESIISHLRCLVRYEPITKRVELAHSSVRDFLTRQHLSGDFYIDAVAADRAMCRVCTEYLVLPEFSTSCPTGAKAKERETTWPFLGYATKMWIEHVRILGDKLPDDIKATIHTFFDSAELKDGGYFAAWYQGMHPQRRSKTWATKPLYVCAREGLTDLLKIILPTMSKEQLEERGGSRGSTALHVAGAFGEVKAVELLLAAGADPNERNEQGENGIQWAWFWGHAATVKALLAGGTDPRLIEWEPNLEGRTAKEWESAIVFLREVLRRQDLGINGGKFECLPQHLAAVMTPAVDENMVRFLKEELISQDFKIPPRARPGSGSYTDRLNAILNNPT